LLKDADAFALVYPLWLNAPPDILKGYLERVFGFGFAYGGGGNSANPLLTGRKLIAFSSSGAPFQWVKETGAFGAVHSLFDEYFAQVCGLRSVDHVHFGGVVPTATRDFVQGRLADVAKSVNDHFGSAA
jgi:NAD(P)H dehydrogenase (quinone)